MTPDLFVPLPYTFTPEPAPFRIEPPAVRDLSGLGLSDDRDYIAKSWLDSYHRARGNHRLPADAYYPRHRPTVERILAAPSTRALVALTPADRVIGWIVWTPSRYIPAVHYALVRHNLDGEEWRRRGVLTALLAAAELGDQFVYTHAGEYRRGGRWKRHHWPRPLDEEIAAALARRGVSATFQAYREWAA